MLISSERNISIFTKPLFLVLCLMLFSIVFSVLGSNTSSAAFNPGNIIDDANFTNYNSMNAAQIQQFLNEKNSTCLKNFRSQSLVDDNGDGVVADSTTETYGRHGTMSAAELINAAAKIYRINPQVLLVTLQKEQGLITRSDCPDWRYQTALGYGCPDTAPCDNSAFGFTRQIDYGAYHFRGYFDDTLNYVPFSVGTYSIGYNPSASCGSSAVNIQNRATASLYSYTPYQPNAAALAAGYGEAPCGAYGNRNFHLYFNNWFGNPVGPPDLKCQNGQNITGVKTGQKVLRNRTSGQSDTMSLFIPNNTNTGCAEVHTWSNSHLQAWLQHTASNSYTFNSDLSTVLSMRVGGKITRFFKVDLQSTGSGRLEVHGWDSTVQRWASHVASASGPINPANSSVVPADTNGDGVDELYIVDYSGTSSKMVEIHGLTSNLQQWSLHSATNLPETNLTSGRVIAADLNGDSRDEFVYIKYGGAESSMVEVHVWSPSLLASEINQSLLMQKSL